MFFPRSIQTLKIVIRCDHRTVKEGRLWHGLVAPGIIVCVLLKHFQSLFVVLPVVWRCLVSTHITGTLITTHNTHNTVSTLTREVGTQAEKLFQLVWLVRQSWMMVRQPRKHPTCPCRQQSGQSSPRPRRPHVL